MTGMSRTCGLISKLTASSFFYDEKLVVIKAFIPTNKPNVANMAKGDANIKRLLDVIVPLSKS